MSRCTAALSQANWKEYPMVQPQWPLVVFALGVLLALVSLFADALGVGMEPGFGWKQTLGLVVGVVAAALVYWRAGSRW
jgi:hypothetical protein